MTIMTIAEIQELIRKDETRTLELKKTTGERITLPSSYICVWPGSKVQTRGNS